MDEDITHVWCGLPVDSAPTVPVPTVDHGPRIEVIAGVVQGLIRKLENLDVHRHPDLDGKIGAVHEAMAETVKSALREARCTQEKAHSDLKLAFGEIATRLESVKTDHKDVSKTVTSHGGRIEDHASQISRLAGALSALEETVHSLPAPTVQVIEKLDEVPAPLWPLICLILLWVADIALRFVPIK